MEIEEMLKKLNNLDIQLTFEDIDEYTEGRHTIAFMVFNVNLLRALILLAQPCPKSSSSQIIR